MKATLCFTLTLLTFVTIAFVPNSFAREVRVIYFLPNDRTAQPDIDSKLDSLLKEVQQIYADVMETNGFGRKTFSLETDTDENVVVHHFTGQFNDTYYHYGTTKKVKEEISQKFDLSNMIYYIAVDISSEQLELPNGTICGISSGNAALTPASGQCFNYRVIAHELGHNFGLSHNRYNYSTIEAMIDSFSAAEWLDVHPAFNSGSQNTSENPTTIEMSPPRLAPSSDAIHFRFTVTDTDGLHQAQLYIPEYDSVIAYKNLNGSSNTTVEFPTTYIQTEINYVTLKIIDVNGRFIAQSFPIDISEFLKPGEIVTIPDANLAAAVRAYLKLDPSATLTTNTMKRLTRLGKISQDPITDLTGLEHATNLVVLGIYNKSVIKDFSKSVIKDFSPLAKLKNLKSLELVYTGISDVSVLKELTNLETLYLFKNAISDVSALTGLTKLKRLELWGNHISDISPLSGLTNLTQLALYQNSISDLSALTGLTGLKWLDLWDNQISDITPLAGLTNLTYLGLPVNQISDITSLAGLTNLKDIDIWSNQISDITPLAALTNLTRLWMSGNQISDITPLAGLTNFKTLNITGNQISDITPLAALTNLTSLRLSKNQISDISPLAALTNLTSLRLSYNQIRDVTPLENLVNLRELYLVGNSIKDRKPLLALLRKNPDIKIYLKNNREPLPVTLSHFRAERTDAGVILKWTTESEVDNAGFYIYRSPTKDGEFKVVNPTLIQGAGTTAERNNYTWTDTTAKPNTVYYYRIEDVSHAGVREQLATVRLRGLVSARGKLTTRWADLKTQE